MRLGRERDGRGGLQRAGNRLLKVRERRDGPRDHAKKGARKDHEKEDGKLRCEKRAESWRL